MCRTSSINPIINHDASCQDKRTRSRSYCVNNAALYFALAVIASCSVVLGAYSVVGTLPRLCIWSFVPTAASSISLLIFLTIYCRRQQGDKPDFPKHEEESEKPFCQTTNTPSLAETEEKTSQTARSKHVEKVKSAWYSFSDDRYIDNGTWEKLPSEGLAVAIIRIWIEEKVPILNQICINFLRDCARAYTKVSNLILQHDELLECFTGFEEFLADIASQDPNFGFQLITSARGSSIANSPIILEIFNISFPLLLEAVSSSSLTEEQAKYFFSFLASYRYVFKREDMDKIHQIQTAIKTNQQNCQEDAQEYETCASLLALLDLLEGKLSLQGIYADGQTKYSPPADPELFTEFLDSTWVAQVNLRLMQQTKEEEIRKGLLYLSLITNKSEHYVNAQMTLGMIWMDLENYTEAGCCFLEAYEHDRKNEDCLMLAATSFLAMQKKDDGQWDCIPRHEMEIKQKESKEVRDLNPEEAKNVDFELLKTYREKFRPSN